MKTPLVIEMLSTTLFVFIVQSCVLPQKATPRPTISFSDMFRTYTQFKEGSYWIYKDSLSESWDSVHLYRNSHRFNQLENVFDCKWETSGMWFTSSHYLDSVRVFSNAECNGLEDYAYNEITVFWAQNHQNMPELKPTVVGDSMPYIGTCYYLAELDSLRLFSQRYDSIRVYRQFPKFQTVPFQTYWTPRIGIIKKYTNDGKVWELVRYRVVQ